MKEIVDRLNENRQVEVAKSILESKGYKVSKIRESESETSDYQASLASEHKQGDGGYYSYITIMHPSLGTFYVSYRVTGAANEDRLRTDGKPWDFLQKKSTRLTPEQLQFIQDNKSDILSKIGR